ncbi:GGDEF domain-containing protein [Fervidicella metallireducens]|nr:GGDEF domain-containing protein [Fervidicella metallireducens]
MKRIKKSTLILFLLMSIIPMCIFTIGSAVQSINYFADRYMDYVNDIVSREERHISNYIYNNLNSVALVSNSDNIVSGEKHEIIDVFIRFMDVNKNFEKMKFVYTNGRVIEVNRKGEVADYHKKPLSYVEATCIEKERFSMLSDENNGKYIVFSVIHRKNGIKTATVIGYVPLYKAEMINKSMDVGGIVDIYIEDSRGSYFMKSDFNGLNKAPIEFNIKDTDWKLKADVNIIDLKKGIYVDVLTRVIILLMIIIVAIIFISIYISDKIDMVVNRILTASKSFTRLNEKDEIFMEYKELNDIAKNYNKMVDIISHTTGYVDEVLYHDKLTGLFSKRYMEEKLNNILKNYEKSKVFFMIVQIDLFEKINDVYGRAIGDILIFEAGKIIRENIRFKDIAIRLGWGEFLIILTDTDLEKANSIAEKIRNTCEEYIVNTKDLEIKFTVSVGVKSYSGDAQETAADLQSCFIKIRGTEKNCIKNL